MERKLGFGRGRSDDSDERCVRRGLCPELDDDLIGGVHQSASGRG
jgi:hypothetical protein